MDFFKNKRNLIIVIVTVVVLIGGGVTVFALLQQQPEPAVVEAPTMEKPVTAIPEAKEEEPRDPAWPLTGMSIEDEALASNRPLSIKIENSPDARPQLGLGSADIVYETITEGGITRFNCLFQSNIPSDVGPVRSARNSDVTLVPQYQGILFYSGANGRVISQMGAAGLDMITEGAGVLFYRVDYRYAPHNLYLGLSDIYQTVQNNGFTITTANPPTLEFLKVGETQSLSSAKPASAIAIPFSDYSLVEWVWSDEAKKYYRWMDGPSTDAANDEQIAVENLVVMWATYTPDPEGGTTLEVNLNGSGKAMVFTEGQWIEGTWETNGTTPPRFKDASGSTIFLTPGQSWFSVVPQDVTVTAQ